jgi:hypothetical protein
MKCSFISIYQESVRQIEENQSSSNTELSTQTRTDSRETPDIHANKFRTHTNVHRETPDIDISGVGFSIIP